MVSSRLLKNYCAIPGFPTFETAQILSETLAGCSKRPFSKAAASEEANRTLGRTLSL